MSLTLGPQLAVLFMLVFARVGVLVMLMPGVGERFLPVRVRLALALFLTLALTPVVRPMLPASVARPDGAMAALLVEIGIGLMIGLTFRLIIASLQTAGNFVSQALGLAFAETVDPSQGGQAAAVGNFMTLLGVTLIFATDAHHAVIAAIGGSYLALPPGMVPATGDAASLALGTMATGFSVAVRLAAPFLVFAIVFNVGLGVLSRLMPALQVFFLAMPATIILGFVILFGVLGLMMLEFLNELSTLLTPFTGR
ncbi:flagellar type III secretion system protein FliR [Alsobacter sp. SYSU M60028]|uniref:Flagellar biosynthetic protein FliR n=1 Tax=Alsobacter ponti TaxID=2962936 RepID=A0ABT1LFY2_9HYPH|nr:flagellar biosynthetic protein FliR [Alsobacter ponti]MCP8940409.1 flagellar type III secretion system protein FliR [Alsobacter ponti]